MQFVISRAKLVKDVPDTATVIFGHHSENAGRAKAYANMGQRRLARWYGARAREDLTSYLEVWRRLGHQP